MASAHTPEWVPPLYDLIRLRRYDITSRVRRTSPHAIGVGSVGTVFLGVYLVSRSSQITIPVVIKHVQGTAAERPKLEKRLAREAMLWGSIKHVNVAEFKGVMNDPPITPLPGLVVAFIPYGLFDYLNSVPGQNRRILQEVACGLCYLHTSYIIHGDIQPSNIRVSEQGTAKLIDFGIGKIQRVRGFTTALQLRPRQTAPELIPYTSDDPVKPTFHSDVYSFSLVILQLLQGGDRGWAASQPYNHIRSDHLLFRYVCEGGRPIRTGYSHINDSDWSLLTACWYSQPRRRPTVQDIRSRLSQIFSQ